MDFRCRCGEWILAGGDEVLVRCPFCERSYRVVADAGGDLVLRPAETAPHETEECQTASRVQNEEQGRPPEVACETPDSAIDSSEVASKPLSEWSEEEFERRAPQLCLPASARRPVREIMHTGPAGSHSPRHGGAGRIKVYAYLV